MKVLEKVLETQEQILEAVIPIKFQNEL